MTQNLPTLGLPFHAEAVVDARNLFGFQTGVSGEEGIFRMNSQGRSAPRRNICQILSPVRTQRQKRPRSNVDARSSPTLADLRLSLQILGLSSKKLNDQMFRTLRSVHSTCDLTIKIN